MLCLKSKSNQNRWVQLSNCLFSKGLHFGFQTISASLQVNFLKKNPHMFFCSNFPERSNATFELHLLRMYLRGPSKSQGSVWLLRDHTLGLSISSSFFGGWVWILLQKSPAGILRVSSISVFLFQSIQTKHPCFSTQKSQWLRHVVTQRPEISGARLHQWSLMLMFKSKLQVFSCCLHLCLFNSFHWLRKRPVNFCLSCPASPPFVPLSKQVSVVFCAKGTNALSCAIWHHLRHPSASYSDP